MKLLFSLTAAFFSFATTQTLTCPTPSDLVPIHAVQGQTERSPFLSEIVETEGVVTAKFTSEDELDGFFIQSLLADDNSATSEGLFIKLSSRSPFADLKLLPGDVVRIKGKVLERNGLTQLDRLESLEVCGYEGLLDPLELTLPLADNQSWEQFEGMLLAFTQPLLVSEVYNLGRYGEVLLSADGRLYHPNNGQTQTDNEARKLLLNDRSTVENPETVPYLAADETLRLGDTVSNLKGILFNYGLGAYRLEPINPVMFERTNPRPTAPEPLNGHLRVAAFNVLNYFTSLNERGADSPEEFERQEAKLVAALSALDADAIGLMEIENNGDGAVQALADKLSAASDTSYSVVSTSQDDAGTDQIKQAIIYRADKLELLNSSSDTASVHDRPPLAATFRELETGEDFSLIVVHFKSKGGCPSAGDTDKGQGCWNLRRAAQSQAVLDFAKTLQAQSGDSDVLLIGDLNSYRLEDPITITAPDFTNLDDRLPLEERYTYVFAGELGTLDYALATPSMNDQVSDFQIWHINSDEPRILDYNQEYNPAYLYRPYPFRSSDHDPLLIGLELRSD